MAEKVTATKRPAAVYRFYDTAGTLLYVGFSARPWKRMPGHKAGSPWWGDVARREVTWFKSAADALSAEARAIAAEQPVHNKQPGRIVPGLGEADAVLSEEEAMRRNRACWIREMDAEGISSEFMTLVYAFSQEEIDQALGGP